MYARDPGWGFEFVTSRIRTVGNASTHLYSQDTDTVGAVGAARVAAYRALPALLHEFGIEPLTVLDAAGVRADVFDDPESLVPYPVLGRLLSLSAQYTNCDHIGLLLGQRSGLATMGLTGEIAFCADTAGEGLRKFAGFFTLQNTAATVSLISGAGFSRLVYAIAEPGMNDTGQLQLGAMALGFNILQELCGLRWRPTVVTFASLAPSNLRPCQKFFDAPLRFNSAESSIVFESHWLDRPLPQVDPALRRRIEAQVQARKKEILADLPQTLRIILRKQLIIGEFSMDYVATLLGIHRRTLDRKLRRYGMHYSDLLESVKRDAACQLLRDTQLQVQRISESLHYSSAANFSTAFGRWTGVSPSKYRRQAR